MPLLFYLNAAIVKLLSFLVPSANSEVLIINVSKTLDSIFLPTLLIPLYLIVHKLIKNEISLAHEVVLLGFVCFSFSPLELTSDFQKNAAAIPFLMFFICCFLQFLKSRSTRSILLSILFLTLTGLIHFGVFSIGLIFILLGIVISHKRRAVVPALIISLLSLLLIGIFDSARAYRLLYFWEYLEVLTMHARMFHYPAGILIYASAFLLLVLTMAVMYGRRKELAGFEKKMIYLLFAFIVVLSFPFLKFDYGRRLILIVFVPQTILLFQVLKYLSPRWRTATLIVVAALTVGSLALKLTDPKMPTLQPEAYDDLDRMSNVIKNPERTIIFTRHGLDWWVAWKLKTNIAISYRNRLNQEIRSRYEDVLFIYQTGGRNKVYLGERSPFKEPIIPENKKLIYHSDYFMLFRVID